MSFMDYLKKALEVIKLNKEVIDELANDEKAMGPAIAIVAISGACWAIGTWSAIGIILMPIFRLIGFFIFFAITHFVATTFLGGAGEFKKLLVPCGFATMVTWVAIFPFPPLAIFFGVLAGLWALVPCVLSVERIYGLDRGKAIIAVAVPLALGIIISAVMAAAVGVGLMMMAR